MNFLEYSEKDAVGLALLIASRQVSSEEVRAAALSAVAAVNPYINAIIEVWADEPEPMSGALSGVPMLVKDIGLTARNRLNELGSRLAQGCIAADDSELMSRLRRAGLTALGRTSIPEFATSTTTENHVNGPTRNPWDLRRSAGGSSGGSAAAVAAGLVPIAHGTDGGGSIRVPAASCGLFGLKPSRGRLPMGPAMEEAWGGMAVPGVLTRTVRDTALVLDLTHGPARGDPFQINVPPRSYISLLQRDLHGLRIAVQTHPLDGQVTHPVIQAALLDVVTTLEAQGHEATFLNVNLGLSWEAFVELNARFWSSNTAAAVDAIASATGRPIGDTTLEPATRAIYRLGKELSATDLLGAMNERNIVSRQMGCFFQDYDLLLTPTLPDFAPFIGAYNAGQETLDGRAWIARVFSHSPFTALANVMGAPAMSVPLAHDRSTGLPIGIQFTAAFGREDILLQLAAQLERDSPWDTRRPTLHYSSAGSGSAFKP